MTKSRKTKKPARRPARKAPVPEAAPATKRPAGLRVRAASGDGRLDLGEGTYLGEATVYFIQMPDGSLRSDTKSAERKPPSAMVPPGAKLIESPNNPKILLDSGRTVYGCQVWWEYIIPPDVKDRVAGVYDQFKVIVEDLPDALLRKVMSEILMNKELRRLIEESLMKGEHALAEKGAALRAEKGGSDAV